MSAIVEIEKVEGIKCPYCKKPSKDAKALREHISKKHRDEYKEVKEIDRPFRCECGTGFPRKGDLKYHQKTCK